MRILKLTSVYPAYQAWFAARHPEVATLPYGEQRARLDHDAFAWADFWTVALAKRGYVGEEVRAHALAFRPDVLFVDDYHLFTTAWLAELRAACPSIRLTLGWCGAPYADASVFRAYDVVLSCIPEFVERFRELGHRSEQLHHAFDPRVAARLRLDGPRAEDFTFIGQIVRGNRFHLERERLLEALARDPGVTIYSPSGTSGRGELWKARAKRAAFHGVALARRAGIPIRALAAIPGLGPKLGNVARLERAPLDPVSPALRPHLRPPVFGLEMFQRLRDSKVTFNSHIDASPRSASNMRLFEATGVGTCLVTDAKENLAELFEPDLEIVAYRSAEECAEKVRWLLAHPTEREAIARAAMSRCHRDHTFDRRAERLDAIIRERLRG